MEDATSRSLGHPDLHHYRRVWQDRNTALWIRSDPGPEGAARLAMYRACADGSLSNRGHME